MAELPGPWRAVEADDELRRHYHERSFDDSEWPQIQVPAHWRSQEPFHQSDGPLLYRTRFTTEAPRNEERVWLVFDGLLYQSDLWVDEHYLGETEGYFFRHSVEISQAASQRDEHVLALEVSCAQQTDPENKANLTGSLQPGGSSWNPGGIWRPVRTETTGAVRARSLRVTCTEATQERATLVLFSELDCGDSNREVSIRTSVFGPDQPETPVVSSAADHTVAVGTNLIEWTVEVPHPHRWWPVALGAQPLYDVMVEVVVDGEVSHRRTRRTGLRTIERDGWMFSVNGERLFLKGAVHGPSARDLSAATADELADDVDLALGAGLDFVRLHAHVTKPEFYEAADRAGLLVWQDLPLTGGYGRGVRKQALLQAHRAVDTLAHHPSVFLWCAHDEPDRLPHSPRRHFDLAAPEADDKRARAKAGAILAQLASSQLPSWNRTVLDRSLGRTLRRSDPSRPVVNHSGVPPHPPQLDGTDRHLWFGWYDADTSMLAGRARLNPRAVRFVSMFGAQAVPDNGDFAGASRSSSTAAARRLSGLASSAFARLSKRPTPTDPGPGQPTGWPHLDWDRLATDHEFERDTMSRWVPPEGYPTFAAWRVATQEYQADLVRRHVEVFRRLKYRPSGGFAVYRLTDAAPSISWSLVDHKRAPKLAYHALSDVCRPIIVVADRLPLRLRAGDPMVIDVHVVSDARTATPDCEATALLTWRDGEHRRRWTGTIDADSVARVGTIQFLAPTIPGELTVHIELTGPTGTLSTFNDRTTVFRP